jgi:hypothetical protein
MTGVIGTRINDAINSDNGHHVRTGQRAVTKDGKEFIYCLVAASQNLISGNVVYIIPATGAGAYTATILATGGAAPGPGTPLGMIVSSVTASASNYVWVQVYGSANMSITDATASNLPNHLVVPASVSGAVRGTIATASSFIEGIVFSATASTGSTGAVFLSYPRLSPA